jgi:uncharacterized protein
MSLLDPPPDSPTPDLAATPAPPALPSQVESLRTLAPQVLTLWLISGSIALVIFLLIAGGLHFFAFRSRPLIASGVYATALALGGMSLALAPLSYRRWTYAIRDKDVLIESGVIWRVRRSIPRSRVQHVDISSGPLARAMGVVQVDLFTAGSLGAVASIPGLTPVAAEHLRQSLITEAHDGV